MSVQDAQYCLSLGTKAKMKDCVEQKGLPVKWGLFTSVRQGLSDYIAEQQKAEQTQEVLKTFETEEDTGSSKLLVWIIVGSLILIGIILFFILRKR